MSTSSWTLLSRLAVSSALVSLGHGIAIPRSVLQARQISDPSELLEAYDYVIVGGGTAGLTVADRLTEDNKTTVLVLESGSFANPADVLPVTGGGTFRQPRMQLTSTPQANLNGKTFPVILGHMVGGSSGVNAMMTARGSAEDYDRWGQLFGEEDNQGWNWDGLLPYFKKAMTINPPPADLTKRFNITYDVSYWGTESPVHATFPSFQYPGLDPLVSAFYELPGVESTQDSGSGGAGVYWFPTFMDPVNFERSYALNAHYENLGRPNYHILADAPGRRVLLEDGTATGVEFEKDSEIFQVSASKEVLLAAGAVHTPKLLQVSGIGPRKVLESAGIETIVDLPGVGQNFQDHSSVGAAIELPGLRDIHPNANDLSADPEFRQWAEELWAANRTGPYSIAFGNVAAWLPLTAITPDNFESLADELENQDHASYLADDADPTVAKGYVAQMLGLAKAMRSKDTVFSRYYVNATTGATRPILNQPFSRGSVNIDPADPFGNPPIVDYRALSNPVERQVMVELIKWYRRYNFETSLKSLGPIEVAPGTNIENDEDLAIWVSEGMNPSDYHPAGTAAMMPLELGGVVDQTLSVYNTKNLRVVDASIMPVLPGANTCQPTYAVAEKASIQIR
ncbi:hypothetical protein B0I35DRAFT_452167 [Stachybotrys elegans]|uniref:Glucose-methanol-choline oxidoreductase N-terminal domain-containing protein n=1 Tax=Stachybotrys elegans TaxID=80388 RepID=A0A8K0SU05_9HYPO|nr:hypothetical protein B0I35DRAFT_452167 [Stachybotrys elegans]